MMDEEDMNHNPH
jgi:hypothetical protein